jgi:hypothetical protein
MNRAVSSLRSDSLRFPATIFAIRSIYLTENLVESKASYLNKAEGANSLPEELSFLYVKRHPLEIKIGNYSY